MRSILLLLPVLLLALGCTSQGPPGSPAVKRGVKEKVTLRAEWAGQDREPADEAPAQDGVAAGQPGGGEQKGAKQAPAEPRKIVYTGHLDLVVDDFDSVRERLVALVKERGGYVARSEVRGNPGAPRTGTWTVRVPAGKFDSFLDEVARLGETLRNSVDSEDITDRYFDTRAEVKNLEAREEALRALYKEKVAGSKLSDVLEVDRELNNVRGQINVRKGQLQRWDKETEYATAVVTVQERKGYRPPDSPDFATSVSRTFEGSFDALKAVGRGLVLAVVALAPWLAVVVVLVLPVGVVVSRRSSPGSRPVRAGAEAAPQAPPPGDSGAAGGVTLPRED